MCGRSSRHARKKEEKQQSLELEKRPLCDSANVASILMANPNPAAVWVKLVTLEVELLIDLHLAVRPARVCVYLFRLCMNQRRDTEILHRVWRVRGL